MAYQPIYSGQAQVRLDAKHRFILTAAFRREAEEEDPSGEFVIAPGDPGSLHVFTKNGWRQRVAHMHAEVRTFAGDQAAFAKAKRSSEYYIHRSTPVKIAEQGRICLPSDLVEAAGLDGDVLVVGSVDHIEIWSPKQYAGRYSQVIEDPQDMLEWVERLALGERHQQRDSQEGRP